MPGITAQPVETYLHDIQPPRDELMEQMEAYADEHDVPIIGPLGGRLLFTLAKAIRAQRILEAGTAIGYTSLWFARATENWGGTVTTLEADEAMAERARDNLAQGGVQERVEVIVGDALQSLDRLKGPFDLCFIDHEKAQYEPFLERALPLVASGGLIVADNVLRQGHVADQSADDSFTRSMRAFNERLMGHDQLEATIVPLRDGIAVAVRR